MLGVIHLHCVSGRGIPLLVCFNTDPLLLRTPQPNVFPPAFPSIVSPPLRAPDCRNEKAFPDSHFKLAKPGTESEMKPENVIYIVWNLCGPDKET